MKRILTLLLVLLLTAPAAAQFTIPYTFSPLTRAQSAQVNANFSLLANALDRRGGTMTGDLIAENIEPSADDTYASGASDARWSNVYSVLGNFSGNITAATLNTFTFDQSVASGASPTFVGTNISGVTEANVTDGALLARLAANEAVTGNWSFAGASFLGVPSELYRDIATSYTRISGGNGASLGSWVALYGQTHATNANQIALVANNGISTTGYFNSASGQPGFFAYLSASTGANTVDDGEVLVFDTELFDGSGSYNNANGVFTAPVTGIYQFCARVSYSDTSGDASGFQFAATSHTFYGPSTTATGSHSHCTYAPLTSGNTISVRATESAIGGITANGAASPNLISYVSGRLVM
jgi:hypothetical protein